MKHSEAFEGYTHGYVEAKSLPSVLIENSPRLQKRLIVCCDGTWNDGLNESDPDQVTNVLKLARCISPQDRKTFPPIPQLVFYQAGIGTTEGFTLNLVEGATGTGIPAKIREAYAFISQNYVPGDEVFIFGFSRGAFTARTIASLIADLGILTNAGMEDFYQVFEAYQQRDDGEAARVKADRFLDTYRQGGPKSARVMPEGTLKCVGVWDTVGALGFPNFFPENFNLLGFKDANLSPKIKYAFHAIAINETRKDFTPTKWHLSSTNHQDGSGEMNAQVLKQVWFAGSHSDVGGGFENHDLSDIALIWMVAHLIKFELLSIDVEYLMTLPEPQGGWGEAPPHDPTTGIMALTVETERKVPTQWNPETCETIHLSVGCQKTLSPEVSTLFRSPDNQLIDELLPFEKEMRAKWKSFGQQGTLTMLELSSGSKTAVDSQNNRSYFKAETWNTLTELIKEGPGTILQSIQRQKEASARRTLENPGRAS